MRLYNEETLLAKYMSAQSLRERKGSETREEELLQGMGEGTNSLGHTNKDQEKRATLHRDKKRLSENSTSHGNLGGSRDTKRRRGPLSFAGSGIPHFPEGTRPTHSRSAEQSETSQERSQNDGGER